PGHANALGALAMAEAAESPVLLLSGHAPLSHAGRGAFQEMDQVALARPLTRWAAVAERAQDIPQLLAQAFAVAQGGQGGRTGPAHLSLPVDVLAEESGQTGGPGEDEPLPRAVAAETASIVLP